MVSDTEIKGYDAIIIGSGQAGNPLARALAGAGLRTALVEKVHVGGTCINEGCTPTKTMVASARVAYLARRAADYGVKTGLVTVDMSVVRRRKRDIVNSFRDGNQHRLETTEGIDLIFGTARFLGPDSLEIVENNVGGTHQVKAERIFINTGGRPSLPKVEGLETIPYLDSTSIMELDELPEHLIALGGGYIGLEFGQIFRRFGSRVTIIQRGEKLLAREDDDISDEVASILREDGLELLTGATTRRAERLPDGQVRLTVATKEGERMITGSHLLVSSGRVPNTEKLNLAAAGIQTDKNGFIVVNERLETNVPGIYALGDVKGGPAFTHISYDDYRIIKANLLEPPEAEPLTTKNRLLPYTCFIDPQLGRVGLNETEAREQGLNFKVAKIPMNYVARALEMDESRGLMKAIVDADSGLILGATVLGIEGGELMAALQIAIIGKLPYTVLREAVFAHPTLAESLNNLFFGLD
jgi:pyruvate/2-oxoglutarate dehydrogenase complex dihydrolipoamide dehydrogenase (E3) component